MAVTIFNTSARVSNRMCDALGRLCVDYAVLENTVNRTIWSLMGLNRKEGRKITASLMMSGRIEKFRKEAKKKFDEGTTERERYDVFVAKLDDIAWRRNLAVHGLWAKGIKKGEKRKWYILTYFKKPGGAHAEIKVADVKALTAEIQELIEVMHMANVLHFGTKLP